MNCCRQTKSDTVLNLWRKVKRYLVPDNVIEVHDNVSKEEDASEHPTPAAITTPNIHSNNGAAINNIDTLDRNPNMLDHTPQISDAELDAASDASVYIFDGTVSRAPEDVTKVDDADFLTEPFWKQFTTSIDEASDASVYIFDGTVSRAPEDVMKVEVADTVTELHGAFYRCRSLISIKIPSSVTTIGRYAFNRCESLRNLTIPPSVTSIGYCAFRMCISLTEIVIPSSVTELGTGVFSGCLSLKSITMPPLNAVFQWNTFHQCVALEHVTISEGSTMEFPNYAFYGMSLKTITISSSITKIGHWAFGACESLEAVTIKSSTVVLGTCAFTGCTNLCYVEMPNSITSFGNGVFDGCRRLPQQLIDKFRRQQSNNKLATGPGSDFEFKGKTQKGWGPEWWGVSLEQIQTLKEHPQYNQVDSDGKKNYLMREYVLSTIELLTDGTGMGWALFMNQDKPLQARVMVSHAWDEPICDFVEAIERSGEEGPFWICALSMYQNNDPSKGVTIAEQLGSDPKFGPFATVLRCVDLMLAVLTHVCDIYTRLWCAYELYFAVTNGVDVRLAPHISPHDLEMGDIEKDICISEAENRVTSIKARCGLPANEMNDDEIAIRNEINNSADGFDTVDKVVERIRLDHLLSYQMETMKYRKSIARDSLKDAIESIILCFPSNTKLQTFDNFLCEKITEYPGFKRIPRKGGEFHEYAKTHDYIISDGTTEYDVFKEWCSSLQEALPKSKV